MRDGSKRSAGLRITHLFRLDAGMSSGVRLRVTDLEREAMGDRDLEGERGILEKKTKHAPRRGEEVVQRG